MAKSEVEYLQERVKEMHAELVKYRSPCDWTYQKGDDFYHTGCGSDTYPLNFNHKYCPDCGHVIYFIEPKIEGSLFPNGQ